MKFTTIKKMDRIGNRCLSLCFIPFIIFWIRVWMMDTNKTNSVGFITNFWPLILTFGLMILGFVLIIVSMIAGGIKNMSILAKGLEATAKVIKVTDTKTTVNDDPVLRLILEVYPQNQPSFRSEAQKLISRIEIHKVRPGIFLRVKYDPMSHDVAIVNITALDMATPNEEQTGFTVILKNAGTNKVKVVQVVREITGLGLKDAYDLVEGAPKPVIENVSEDEAISIMIKLEEAGAVCDLKAWNP